VQLAVEAASILSKSGTAVRVVSMPCTDRFETQAAEYKELVLPFGVPSLSVEAGSTFGWARWVDKSIGIDRFGASAPGGRVMSEFGITVEAVVASAESLMTL
jgi:transketolase